MEFGLLGPITVVRRAEPLALGGPRQRTVLAHLLLRANREFSQDHLIDKVWGENPPVTARGSLQTYVSRLRTVLGAERLEGHAGRYVLHVAPDEVDALRFESLTEQARRHEVARPAEAAEAYRDALALWRGPALEDLADESSLRPEAVRLDELRVTAIEGLVGADLALGRHRAVVRQLEPLLDHYPFREQLWGQLMVALYRSGRQQEALEVYDRVRSALADELGLDPWRELQRLRDQIVRQDADLDFGGQPLHGYRLIEQVGRGTFGTVHRALQPDVGREVAVKVIRPEFANKPEFVRRFGAEAEIAARLEHPHVVPLHDYWREPDGAFLVMRYLRGGSLRDRLAEGPMAAHLVVRLVEQISFALSFAHRQGIVHRDVKPANILFDEDGNAYLTDFGIATEFAPAEGDVDRRRSPLPAYLSPEEVRGESVDARADIYSLGVVAFEALTGSHPFADTSWESLPGTPAVEPLPSLHAWRPDLPAAVDAVIARATTQDRADRSADVVIVAEELREVLAPASRAGQASAESVVAVEARNPYKGLRAFKEADADDFYGRTRLVDDLVDRLRDDGAARFLAVVGPSGSGKSSLVRAGLLPALRRGEVPASESWFCVQMHPGAHPFEELATALTRVAAVPQPGLVDELRRGDLDLSDVPGRLLPDPGAELLLVIDQFEEIFTLVDDSDIRSRFLTLIAAAMSEPRGRVRVIVTLRADFYDLPLSEPAIARLVGAGTVSVTPLTPGELERAITAPAEAVGVSVEPALVATLVADVTDQAASLPLLQYALTEIFERRDDARLTLAAYDDVGGVSGALARRAEDLYRRLPLAGQVATRQLFLRLVTVGVDGAGDTRRRETRPELTGLDIDSEAMDAAIDAFGTRRLLTFDRDPRTRAPTIEVAHEALLSEWVRLRGWIEAARDDVLTHRRMAAAAREWSESGQDESALLRGERLRRLEAWATTSGLAMTGNERTFLTASATRRDVEVAAEQERAARERAFGRRSLIRLRATVAVVGALALVTSVLTVLALDARREAESERRVATARELAAAAVANLTDDPERSILLALASVEETRSSGERALPEAVEALHRAVTASRVVLRVPDVGGGLDWSPDGSLFVTEGPEESGMIDIRDVATGDSVRSFRGHDDDVNDVAFSEDGSLLATSGDDGALRVWAPDTGEELLEVRGSSDGRGGRDVAVWAPSFSADGTRVAAAWPDAVRVVDLLTEQEVTIPAEAPTSTALSPDGTRVAYGLFGGPTATVVDASSGKAVFDLVGQNGIRDLAWSPDGRWLATAGDDGTAGVWDGVTGELRFTVTGHTGLIWELDWSPDSTRLATAGDDGTAQVSRITKDGPRSLFTFSAQDTSRGGGLGGVAFSPDGQRLMAGDSSISSVTIWDATDAVGGEGASEVGMADITPDSRRLVLARPGGAVSVVAADTGDRVSLIRESQGRAGRRVWWADLSEDGRRLALVESRGISVVDVETGTRVFTLPWTDSGLANDLTWSNDGRLLAIAYSAAGRRGHVLIVDDTGLEVARLPEALGHHTRSVSFSADGRLLATTRWGFEAVDPTQMPATIWDWERGQIATQVGTSAELVEFDPSGSLIATSRPVEGIADVWDAHTGRRTATLTATAHVLDLVFDASGTQLASSHADGTVRLWDPQTGVQTLVLHVDRVVDSVRFSPDGSMLVTQDGEHVQVWTLDLDDLIDLARSKLTRGFSLDECRQYLHLNRCPGT